MVPANRGRHASILSSSTRILKTKFIDGSYKGTFEECVTYFDDIESPILVMDNVTFHHIKEVC